MKKFEIQPYIISSEIGEVQVTISLSDEEVNKCREMSVEEFRKFIAPRAVIKITDFDVDVDFETLDSWVEVD